MSEQTGSEAGSGNSNAQRIAELQAEIDSLQGEEIEAVEEAIEEAVEEVEEAVEGAVEEVVEQVEESTGETLSAEDVSYLKGMIAERVAQQESPEAANLPAEPAEVAEVAVEEVAESPDSAPIRTHVLDRKLWGNG